MVRVNGYNLRKYTEHKGMEGLAFEGELMKGKTFICSFRNEGSGGATNFTVNKAVWETEGSALQKLMEEKNYVYTTISDKELVMEILIEEIAKITDTINSAKKDAKKWDADTFHLLVYSQETSGYIYLHYYYNFTDNFATTMKSRFANEKDLYLLHDIVLNVKDRNYDLNIL